MSIVCALLVLLGLSLASVGGANVARGSTLHDVTGTPVSAPPHGKVEGAATPPATRPPSPWEPTVLQAVADALSWPTEVTQGPGGKYSVQLDIPGQEWYQAWILPFETDAGAGAALSAEMEDLRVTGFRVAPTQFYGNSAYVAVMEDEAGRPFERRLAWHVAEWIMGIAVRGNSPSARAFDPQVAAQHLLYLAVQAGVPEPAGGIEPPVGLNGTPTAAPTPAGCGVSFDDVPTGHWAEPYITQLACADVVSGYADGTFRPQNPTTRAQLVKMLALSEGWELASPAIATFPDVPPSHMFFRYVETAVREHVVSGFSDGRFRPDFFVTRAQVAKMLVEARDWELGDEFSTVLCDVPRSHWAWAYIHTAVEHGAFRGYANGCFAPDAVATRAQLAKVLVNARR